MSTHRPGPHSGGPALRLLILDGTPGAATLLVLAAHRALPRPDVLLIPDTGWYPAPTYTHLDRLARLAASAGIEVLWVDAGATITGATLDPTAPCPLPLHTRGPDGTPGRLPGGCAQRQTAALDAALRHLLGHARTPGNTVAECVLGLSAEHAAAARRAEAAYRRNRYPLVELGWRAADCRAHLAMHDLAYRPDMACIACPNRSNTAWSELAATAPEAWHEAVAVDAALRHRPATAASGGMPSGTTGYLHPVRVPLAEVDLDAAPDTGSEGCVPHACRGMGSGTSDAGGWCRVNALAMPLTAQHHRDPRLRCSVRDGHGSSDPATPSIPSNGGSRFTRDARMRTGAFAAVGVLRGPASLRPAGGEP